MEAIAKAKNLVSKDEAEKAYKKYMEKQLSAVSAQTGKDPEDLEKDHTTAKAVSLTVQMKFSRACCGWGFFQFNMIVHQG